MKKKGTVAPDKMQEEVYVTMLADLQQKQTSEDGALSTVLSTSADKVIIFLFIDYIKNKFALFWGFFYSSFRVYPWPGGNKKWTLI